MSSGTPAENGPIRIEALGTRDAGRYVEQVFNSSDYRRFRDQLLQNAVFTLVEQDASASNLVSGHERAVIVHVPIAGGAGNSLYSAVLDPSSLDIRTSYTGLFSQVDEQIAVVVEQNGTATLDALMAQEGDFVSGTLNTPDGPIALDGSAVGEVLSQLAPGVDLSFLGCLNSCLASQGIPNWLIGVISVGCGFACAATMGAACIPCLAALAGAYAGQMAGCIRNCS